MVAMTRVHQLLCVSMQTLAQLDLCITPSHLESLLNDTCPIGGQCQIQHCRMHPGDDCSTRSSARLLQQSFHPRSEPCIHKHLPWVSKSNNVIWQNVVCS